MSSHDLLKASSLLKNMNIFFTYTGSLGQNSIENLCQIIESYLKVNIDKRKILSKMLSIFIELSQNIDHYLSKKDMSVFFNRIIADSSVICVGSKNESLFVYSGNWIENVDVETMEYTLKKLNNMTIDEINSRYRVKMNSCISPNEKSAGLGLMQLFRKSRKIEHEIIPKDDTWSFLTFKIII